MSVNPGRVIRKIIGWALIVYGIPFLICSGAGIIHKEVKPDRDPGNPRAYVRAVDDIAMPIFVLLGGIYLIRGPKNPPDDKRPVDRWH
jgi:hypothetical protein